VTSRRHSVLGWLAWQIGKRVAKRKVTRRRSKLAPIAVIVAVVLAGFWLKAGDEG
jgi:hypothetical protein